jgi:hypothetical protein
MRTLSQIILGLVAGIVLFCLILVIAGTVLWSFLGHGIEFQRHRGIQCTQLPAGWHHTYSPGILMHGKASNRIAGS